MRDGLPQEKQKPVGIPAIYELDGETLKICVSYGGKRPTDFTTKPGAEQQQLYVFRRARPSWPVRPDADGLKKDVPDAKEPEGEKQTKTAPADEEDEATAIKALEKWGGIVGSPDAESGANSMIIFGYKGWLSDADLKDAAVHLRKLPNLRVVSLNFTGVTDAGLAYLADLPKLRELHLKVTRVTDAGLSHLLKMSELRKIDLTLTRVSEKGVAELKKTLPKAEVLSSSTDKTTAEAKKLRGVWRGHRILPGNKKEEVEQFLVVAGNDLAFGIRADPLATGSDLALGREAYAGPFSVNPDTKPKSIDFEFTDCLPGNNFGPSSYLGIYRLEGDTLTLCFRPARREDAKRRPTAFSPDEEKRVYMYVFKREKE